MWLFVHKGWESDPQILKFWKYLGTILTYSGSYVPDIKALSAIVTKAMFALLQKGCKLSLDVATMLHLFGDIVTQN